MSKQIISKQKISHRNTSQKNWDQLQSKIITCTQCTRLRKYCKKISLVKRASFNDQKYWGKPVPNFGNSNAKLMIIGLAPAAHGANRTGRMFTGDKSGEWLYRALFKTGFANQQKSENRSDGLKLNNAMITAIAHCAPPENKPSTQEIENCSSHLKETLQISKHTLAYLCLGKIAYDQTYKQLKLMQMSDLKNKPKFKHGLIVDLKYGMKIFCSYHPSQQNTFTKRLTEPMFDLVFERIRKFISK